MAKAQETRLRQGTNTCNRDFRGNFDDNPSTGKDNNRLFGFSHLKNQAMRTLLASSTVLFTILCSLAFGIACGYVAIAAILRALGHKPKPQGVPATAAIATTVSSR